MRDRFAFIARCPRGVEIPYQPRGTGFGALDELDPPARDSGIDEKRADKYRRVMHPPSDCWLSSSVGVRHSPIDGTGLFALRAIPEATLVARLGGTLVSTEELYELFEDSDEYIDAITVDADEHLVLAPGNLVRYGNHSCDPNLWWEGPFDLVARRDIEVGEEISNDYSASTTDPNFAMSCRCSTATCRGTVTGSDAWVHRLDKVYARHLVPSVLNEVAAQISTEPRPI